jgi:large subunit ribosomal protein L29
MNVSEFRDMDDDALARRLLELRKEQFNLRMQRASGQMGQTHLLAEARRDIARVKTVMRERRADV